MPPKRFGLTLASYAPEGAGGGEEGTRFLSVRLHQLIYFPSAGDDDAEGWTLAQELLPEGPGATGCVRACDGRRCALRVPALPLSLRRRRRSCG